MEIAIGLGMLLGFVIGMAVFSPKSCKHGRWQASSHKLGGYPIGYFCKECGSLKIVHENYKEAVEVERDNFFYHKKTYGG